MGAEAQSSGQGSDGVISILELTASSRGGGAVHVRDLVRTLDPGRFAPTVAMAQDGGNVTAADFTEWGVSFQQLDIASGPSLTGLLILRRLLKQGSFDILHCHGARAALHGRLAAASLGNGRPKVLFSVHGFAAPHYGLPRRTILLGIERALMPVTDAVICVSDAERQDFLQAGFGPPERIHLVRHGIDARRFRGVVVDKAEQRADLGLPSHGRVVTTICRLYRPRDFTTLLTGFAMVRDELGDAHLLIVGDGPYRPRIESLVHGLNLEPHVTLAGFRRDIPQILAISDVFVLSTAHWEALGLTLLEAMASQVPVVASDVGGIKEAMIDQETGILVPPQDPAALSEALLDLLVDEQHAMVMGQKGRERVERLFMLDRMGRETMAVYDHLMQSQSEEWTARGRNAG
jgi:glycosyltransferase involved in cell wall biosynthesis